MARLLSVNVGLPRDIEWHGRTVHTGIFKSPVQGRRRVRRLNIEGDGQGDLAGMAASSGPSSSTRSNRIATGNNSLGAAISCSGSSVKTSPLKAGRTTRCALAIAFESAAPCLK